jgi:hypothetical protein
VAHVLVGKADPTFPEHALRAKNTIAAQTQRQTAEFYRKDIGNFAALARLLSRVRTGP